MGFSTTISSLLSAVHGFMDNAYLKRDPWIKSGPAGSVKVTHHSGKLCASNLEGLQLTGAVNLRDPDDPTILKEGFKETAARVMNDKILCLKIAAHAGKILDLYRDLIGVLGDEVQVVLESSHAADDEHDNFYALTDKAALESAICGFEDLLLNDSNTGISVFAINEDVDPREVKLSGKKVIFVYGYNLAPYRNILESYGIKEDPDMTFIDQFPDEELDTYSRTQHFDQVEQLKSELNLQNTQ